MSKYEYLKLADRKKIKECLLNGMTSIEIAKLLKKHYNTIRKEIRKNGGRHNYNPELAQELFFSRRPSLRLEQQLSLLERIEILETQFKFLIEELKAKGVISV